MKYLYIVFGLVLTALAIFLTITLFREIDYSWATSSIPSQILNVIAVWVFAISTLFYGFKPEKINVWSNTYVWILIVFIILYTIIPDHCGLVGGSCPSIYDTITLIKRISYPLVSVVSMILLVKSFFRTSK